MFILKENYHPKTKEYNKQIEKENKNNKIGQRDKNKQEQSY